MAFSVEELRKEYEQTKKKDKDGLKEAFLFLKMAFANYLQTLQQMKTAEEEEGEEEAIFNEFQDLTKKEGRGKGREMKDLRFKKTFKKKKNKVQNQYNDSKQKGKGIQQRKAVSKVVKKGKNKVQNQHNESKQKGKGIQQRRIASKAEARRVGGRKVWWRKKGRKIVEKSHKVLKLDGKKGSFFRDKG